MGPKTNAKTELRLERRKLGRPCNLDFVCSPKSLVRKRTNYKLVHGIQTEQEIADSFPDY